MPLAATTVVATGLITSRLNIDSLWRRVRSASPNANIVECNHSDETAAALRKSLGRRHSGSATDM